MVIKNEKEASPKKSSTESKTDLPLCNDEDKDEEEEIDAESKFYKVDDQIDCTDASIGSWFEAKILKIITKGNKLLYKVQWDLTDAKDDEPFNVEENKIRPRAWKILDFNSLDLKQKVMLNHNLEEPGSIGNWYDFTISKIKNTQGVKELKGTLHIGNDTGSMENCTIKVKTDVYEIESPVLLSERDDELIKSQISSERRKLPVKCKHCKDNPNRTCRECSCRACGRKHDPHLTLLCDECNDAYHLACLKPPLTELPEEDDWYCPDCKVNENEVIKVGQKAHPKKKPANLVGSTRDWGKGFACVGRTKTCTIVPNNHRGPIPGIDVGTSWKFRVQVSEAGVHRPPVAGISGSAKDCAYSIVLSGGYEDDVDDGVQFLYTGAGGRDLSGNKRTAKQGFDQTLTLTNLALARNCNAPVNATDGNESKDWKKGIPIRVVRNSKLAKHSKYAPEEGNRYDGIYKVVKYWQETGQSGFKVWRYMLRRDDPAPPPWTKEGKKRIESLGLQMIYPDGYHEAQKKKLNDEKRKSLNKSSNSVVSKDVSLKDVAEENISPKVNQKNTNKKSPRKRTSKGTKRKSEVQIDKFFIRAEPQPTKKIKTAYELSEEVKKLVEEDTLNVQLWNTCNEVLINGKQEYLEKVSVEFACVICQDLVVNPNTTLCSHNICSSCLKRSFSCNTFECPMCRNPLDKDYKIEVNQTLSKILLNLFPGYDRR